MGGVVQELITMWSHCPRRPPGSSNHQRPASEHREQAGVDPLGGLVRAPFTIE